MTVRTRALILVSGVLLLAGCQSRDDVRARYELERRLWQAQLHERRINLRFVRASQGDIALAIDAFTTVVNVNPLASPGVDTWDPRVADDIRRIQMTSRIALANLHFLAHQYREAGSVYGRTLEGSPDFRTSLDARLGVVRSLYLVGDEDSLEAQCQRIFDDMADNPAFWKGKGDVPGVFINVPLILGQMYSRRNDAERLEQLAARARVFYDRVLDTWPDAPVSVAALQARMGLAMVLEEWELALETIAALEADTRLEDFVFGLTLVRGEILARDLGRRSEAVAVFESIVRDAPGTPESFGARFNLATMALESGAPARGLDEMRAIEQEKGAPPDVASRAMLVRALHYEQGDRWDEALPILRRLTQLYPHTQPAIEAPLVITRHYVSTGETALAQRSLQRATTYYLSLLDRSSRFQGSRLLVADLLVENYVSAGQADGAARLLEDAPGQWDTATTVGGLFRSALLYSELLEDNAEAIRILEKCIEMFPETRYAKIAQRQLERLRSASGADTRS